MADLPYAHESVEGADYVKFFNPDDAHQLAREMKKVISGELGDFCQVVKRTVAAPCSNSWEGMFSILLK